MLVIVRGVSSLPDLFFFIFFLMHTQHRMNHHVKIFFCQSSNKNMLSWKALLLIRIFGYVRNPKIFEALCFKRCRPHFWWGADTFVSLKKAPRHPHTVRIYGVDYDETSLLSLAISCVFLLFITNVEGRAISGWLVMSLLSHVWNINVRVATDEGLVRRW